MNKNNNFVKEDKYIFWTEDLTILFKNDKYLEFFPTTYMTRIEQLNAITRLCIYCIILLIITGNTEGWIQLPIIVIIFITLLYYILMSDSESILKAIKNDKKRTLEHMSTLGGSTVDHSNNPINNDEIIIESGYYDSDNKLHLGEYLAASKKKSNNDYTFEEISKYKKSTCKKPTVENPFMNPNYEELNLDIPPEACNADDEDIKEQVVDCFNKDLFRDVSDLFDIKNSQRQFYTVAVPANPPDQSEFARWLAKGTTSCKDSQAYCLGYENLKYKR